MKAIWRFECRVDDEITIPMPEGAEVLSVGIQQAGAICIWALCNQKVSMEPRRFVVKGTGHPADDVHKGDFIGTVFDRQFVWHVFHGD